MDSYQVYLDYQKVLLEKELFELREKEKNV